MIWQVTQKDGKSSSVIPRPPKSSAGSLYSFAGLCESRPLLTGPVLDPSANDCNPTSPAALEKHYSVPELAKIWFLSENTVRRIFLEEPGVLKLAHEETRHKRRYTTLRIPERIAQRVHRRLQGLA